MAIRWPWDNRRDTCPPEEDVSGLMVSQPLVIKAADIEAGWSVYVDADTGALVQAYQRKLPGVFSGELGDVEMRPGDYLVSPPGGGRRVIRQEVFESRFRLREGG